MKKPELNIVDLFSNEQLEKKEMSLVLGGSRRKPKSRDKDVYDTEEDDD